jgi:hypothetical protein
MCELQDLAGWLVTVGQHHDREALIMARRVHMKRDTRQVVSGCSRNGGSASKQTGKAAACSSGWPAATGVKQVADHTFSVCVHSD